MQKVKQFIQENYMFLLFYILLITIFTYPIPYYIYNGGGILAVDDRIEFTNKTLSEGSYNLCYVKEIKATPTSYLIALLNSNWDIVGKEEIVYNENETDNDVRIRDQIYLDQANSNAIISAFRSSNNYYKIIDTNPVVLGIDINSKTNLKIGDEILEIDDNKVDRMDDITKYINTKNIGDILKIKVVNNDKEYLRKVEIIKLDNTKKIGIILDEISKYETDREINFNFKNGEGGPSGGFMMSLALYDYLVDEDLSKGLKIAGTGTIDIDGNVGSIGGVKYKLKGSVDSKANVFFVPNGENYNEAIKLKEKYNYKIDIVGVSTLDDAVKYLESK